jgi:hypothetical protein
MKNRLSGGGFFLRAHMVKHRSGPDDGRKTDCRVGDKPLLAMTVKMSQAKISVIARSAATRQSASFRPPAGVDPSSVCCADTFPHGEGYKRRARETDRPLRGRLAGIEKRPGPKSGAFVVLSETQTEV